MCLRLRPVLANANANANTNTNAPCPAPTAAVTRHTGAPASAALALQAGVSTDGGARLPFGAQDTAAWL